MKIIPKINENGWSPTILNIKIKKFFKKKYKQRITVLEINKIWGDYVQEDVINTLSVGGIVNIDSDSRIWVKASPTSENKRFMALLNQGLMYRNGKIVEANLNMSTSEYIYDIIYETKRWNHKTKLFFQPHRNLSKAVRQGILNGKLITKQYVN